MAIAFPFPDECKEKFLIAVISAQSPRTMLIWINRPVLLHAIGRAPLRLFLGRSFRMARSTPAAHAGPRALPIDRQQTHP
jgi:hypothetical protein